MTRSLVRAAASLLTAAAALPALALEVGQKAPEIEVSEWLQGGAAKLADEPGRKVWLVVLWGTFESDCVDVMPDLNRVYAKHKAAGFDVVAVSTEPVEHVRTFLAQHKLDYRVAVDQFHKTSEPYGEDVRKLPMSWLVDKTGTVVWKGDPSHGVERVLTDVLAGTFDPERARALAKRQQELSSAFWDAISNDAWAALADKCEAILFADPSDSTAFSYIGWAFHQIGDHERFRKFMKEHVARCEDDAEALRDAADTLATEGGPEWRELDLAHAAIRRAIELTKSGDAEVLATYAEILFLAGLPDQAAAELAKSVALDGSDEDRKALLGWYQACAAAKKKAAKPKK